MGTQGVTWRSQCPSAGPMMPYTGLSKPSGGLRMPSVGLRKPAGGLRLSFGGFSVPLQVPG